MSNGDNWDGAFKGSQEIENTMKIMNHGSQSVCLFKNEWNTFIRFHLLDCVLLQCLFLHATCFNRSLIHNTVKLLKGFKKILEITYVWVLMNTQFDISIKPFYIFEPFIIVIKTFYPHPSFLNHFWPFYPEIDDYGLLICVDYLNTWGLTYRGLSLRYSWKHA